MKQESEEEEKFSESKAKRDKFCHLTKDPIFSPIITKSVIENGLNYHAILMPCLYGEEAFILQRMGVPMQNIFALERKAYIHKEIVDCKRKDRKELFGMKTTLNPMPAYKGLERARSISKYFDLIYLDYFGQPDPQEHYQNTFQKIFKMKMLKSNGILITTFGLTRSSHETSENNKKLLKKLNNCGIEFVPTIAAILAAIESTNHPLPKKFYDSHYISTAGSNRDLNYVTTIFEF